MIKHKLLKNILEHGTQYTPALLPADIPRGKVGECFDHCVANALGTKYGYVEGVARDPKGDQWILHAWLTDGIHAYDPTWRAFDLEGKEIPVPTVYIGIELNLKAVAKFMLATRYAGVIPNAFRNPLLAREAMRK